MSVNAFANDGYVFIGWTGSSTSTFSEVEITMNSGKYLTAVFETAFNLVEKITFLLGLENGKLDVLREVTEKLWKFVDCEIYEIILRSNSSYIH